MTGNIRTTRPARAAIAAVLAVTATPLFAQEVVPPSSPAAAMPTPTPVVPPAVVNAPAAPAATETAPTVEFKPTQPVVQSTPPVEERIAAARAASEAEATPAAASVNRASAQRTASRPSAEPAARAAAPAPAAPAATEAPAAPRTTAAEAAPVAPAAPAVAEAEPAASTPAMAANNDAMLWGIGGGALLLIGIAGTALARRRRRDDVDMVYDEPVVATEPVVTPAVAAPAPAFERSMRPAPVAFAQGDADLDAMVAAPPSAENPFLTRAKRLRRARQLIAERQAAAAPMAAPQTTHAEPVAAPVDRSQTVYRFGGQGASSPGFLKPRTR